MSRIRASRFLLGVCVLTRFLRWVTIGEAVICAVFTLFLFIFDRPDYHPVFLVLAGFTAISACMVWGGEKRLWKKYLGGM